MELLTPVTYRLFPYQDAWLQQAADKQGHGSKAQSLRMLLDLAMRRDKPVTCKRAKR